MLQIPSLGSCVHLRALGWPRLLSAGTAAVSRVCLLYPAVTTVGEMWMLCNGPYRAMS